MIQFNHKQKLLLNGGHFYSWMIRTLADACGGEDNLSEPYKMSPPRESRSSSSNLSNVWFWHGFRSTGILFHSLERVHLNYEISQIIIDKGSDVMESIRSKQLSPFIKSELLLFQSYMNLANTMGVIWVQFRDLQKNGAMISSSSPKAEPHKGGSLCPQMLIKK